MANNQTIHQWGFHGYGSQKWVITHIGGGYYSLRTDYTEEPYYLGLRDETAQGEDVVLRYGNLTDGMKWVIRKTINGTYTIIPKNGEANGQSLEVSTSEPTYGAKLVQVDYDDDGSSLNEWKLIRAKYTLANYYDSTFVGNSTLLSYIPEANEFVDRAFNKAFGLSFAMEGSAQYDSDALADKCDNKNSSCTTEKCGENCEEDHHKNVKHISKYISDKGIPEGQRYVSWSNRAPYTFCQKINGKHKTINPYGLVCTEYPSVIQILSVFDVSGVDLAGTAISLAHETAHTFGMDEAYNDPGHDIANTYRCIMEIPDARYMNDFYRDVLKKDSGVQAFCDSCRAKIQSLILD